MSIKPIKPWDAQLAYALVSRVQSTSITPNHFTTLRLCFGLAGASLFALGENPNLAACAIVISNFLDHTDGELARLNHLESRFGHLYDLLSDAFVTIAMFAGIGIGLRNGNLGIATVFMGLVAGIAVALIFHLRQEIEETCGKSATRQPSFAGFEVEDVLYALPIVTLLDALPVFLIAAALGAPLAAILVVRQYLSVRRQTAAGNTV